MNPLDQNTETDTGPATLDRRTLLRNGGLALSLGAIVAACGSGRSGSTDPGRIGTVPTPSTLPDAEVTDIVLLRTAQSLEHTVLAVYAKALASGELSQPETTLVDRFVADHTRHGAALGALITGLGGAEFKCANPFLMDRTINPILEALDGSDDAHRDLLNLAHAMESLAGASYQALVKPMRDGALRREAARICGEEQRHAVALARTINPDQVFSPTFFGQPDAEVDGFPLPYAIPSTFGRIAAIPLVAGAPDPEDGTRFSTQLQTPAANTFVYEYQRC